MTPKYPILASAQGQFPKSANKTIIVSHAWRPTGDRVQPEPNGPEGWDPVGQPATYSVVSRLKDQGYTWVNLQAGGVAWPFKDVAISRLI